MITIDTPTFLTCPRCHRMTEARVAVCDITTGGCGYEVPSAPHTDSETGAGEQTEAGQAALADDSSKDG